jgi:hypothetical protein
MSDNVADGLLLDVRELDLADLEVSESAVMTALDLALERILASNSACNFNSFGASIA